MCLIIDACCIHCVFNDSSTGHNNFKPILEWIINKEGKIIYGGTKYKNELKKAIGKYRRLFQLLESKGKIILLDDAKVDGTQKEIEALEINPDFDDPHLIAIIIESGCRIICTNDKRAIRFLKDTSLYPCSRMRPKIYSSKRNEPLIKDSRNMVAMCKR